MKRFLKIFGLVVVALVIGVVSLFVASFATLKPLPDGLDLGGVRLVKDGFVAAYVIDAGPGAVALVDAGNDKAGKAILADLARRGLGPEGVKAIFLTHGHRDHTGGVALFPKADVLALADEGGIVEGREGSQGPFVRLMPVHPTGIRVTHPLKDGEAITLGDLVVRVYAVPGHTKGSAAYLARGVLFLGDSADQTRGGGLAPARRLFSDSVPQNERSLGALAGRLTAENQAVRWFAFGHSGPLEAGVAALRSAFPAR